MTWLATLEDRRTVEYIAGTLMLDLGGNDPELASSMVYMVVERFKNRDAAPVYARFAERGRMMPEGLRYVASWVETNWDRCFQVMECDDPALFAEWMVQWADLVDFEIVPVISSADAVRVMRERPGI